jgi:hypothetical protein
MSNIENAKRIIGERVEVFARNREQYRRAEYKEAQLRREFLDPFFEALGWDVQNKQGWAEQYKEVVNEDALKMAGTTKAPDYSFRIGGARKFFAEAKKPALTIKTDALAAYQLRRYAWSAQLPLSLLTDFEELAVYDCRARPSEKDSAKVGRINFFTFDEYLDRLDEIYAVFSKEAVLRGSFDRYAQEQRGRGTAPVDAEFLKEIERWRVTLAKNLAQLNPRLTLDELNDAVQRTLDRLIFLRMAEDRGAEEYGRLQRLVAPLDPAGAEELRALAPEQIVKLGALTGNKGSVYARFIHLCRDAATKYDSGLFDFDADQLTPGLVVDDDKLRGIIADLYYPRSPYEFSVLAADTLGNVYEQFLGKVIRLTPAHQAKIEEKPAVKKAGGVFYTPAYIVAYIVQQTVGRMIAGKSPQEIATLRVLDPACGSGSFLLGAYQCLLEHCLNWYIAHRDAKEAKGKIYESAKGWRLTTAEKKRILTTHIFGVDIDRQAVEVTKLALLLQVLEDETRETLGKQLALFNEPALPNLDANIQCGNALIGTDCFAGQLLPDKEALRRVNPFDWTRGFANVMREGGFDCVIGNPPYIRIQTMKEWAPLEVELYKEKYAAARAGNYDIYVVFVEKGLSLLKPGGRLGFILPHKFFNAQYGAPLRELIARGKHLAHVVHFGDQQVFSGATTYTCLMFLDKNGADACRWVKVNDVRAWREQGTALEGTVGADKITRAEWNFAVGAGAALFEKLAAMPVKLGDVADIFVGLQTSADDVFILEFVAETPRALRMKSRALDAEWTFEKELLFPLVSGTDVNRYEDLPERQYILFPYTVQNESAQLINWETISDKFPKVAAYLLENKKTLEGRERGKFKGHDWYRFGRNQNIGIQRRVKLCVPRLVEKLYAAYDIEGNHFLDNVDVGGITLTSGYNELGLPYLLGLINSSLLRWYFPFVSAPFRGGWRSANRQFLSQLPIRVINFDDAQDVARYHRIVALVEQMLALHKQRAAARTAADREMFQRQIDATDAQINAVVYALYGLTEEEIRVVEG